MHEKPSFIEKISGLARLAVLGASLVTGESTLSAQTNTPRPTVETSIENPVSKERVAQEVNRFIKIVYESGNEFDIDGLELAMKGFTLEYKQGFPIADSMGRIQVRGNVSISEYRNVERLLFETLSEALDGKKQIIEITNEALKKASADPSSAISAFYNILKKDLNK